MVNYLKEKLKGFLRFVTLNFMFFFQNLDVPVDLIKDYNDLMVALASGADIDPVAFEIDCNSWLDRFHENDDLNWCILSPTVRKK